MQTRDPRMTEPNLHGIRRSLTRGTPAVVLMLILVGCGGGTQAPAGASPSQPQASAAGVPTSAPSVAATTGPGPVVLAACDYFNSDDVATTVGMSHPIPMPSEDELYSYCTYSAPGAPELKIFVTKTTETATTAFNTAKANKGEAVSGVGDEAYWSTDSFLPGLYLMKSGLLGYISGSSSGPEDRIIELGKLFAERIAEVN
jgi:hypothetical protein